MRLRFTARATQDLAGIADYIHEHDPAYACAKRYSIRFEIS
jgi:plasmid stabilization system protein ParE